MESWKVEGKIPHPQSATASSQPASQPVGWSARRLQCNAISAPEGAYNRCGTRVPSKHSDRPKSASCFCCLPVLWSIRILFFTAYYKPRKLCAKVVARGAARDNRLNSRGICGGPNKVQSPTDHRLITALYASLHVLCDGVDSALHTHTHTHTLLVYLLRYPVHLHSSLLAGCTWEKCIVA